MTLWEKIRDNVQKTASEVSSKAEELIKSGAEAVKEGAEEATTKATYYSKLAQLNWDQRNVQHKIERVYPDLGRLLFDLHKENRLKELETMAEVHFNKLSDFEKELQKIETQKEKLAEEYGMNEPGEMTAKELTQNLQARGGTFLQIKLTKTSPVIGKALRQIKLPKEALIVSVMREEQMIIPDGNTLLQENDSVNLIGKKEDVEEAIQSLLSEEAKSE